MVFRERCPRDGRAQYVMGECDRRVQPSGSGLVRSQEIVPVEIGRARLERRPDIAQGERATDPVGERVGAKQVEMVFGPRDPNPRAADQNSLSVGFDLFPGSIPKISSAFVQVDGKRLSVPEKQCSSRALDLIGSHMKIDIRVGSQAWLGVEPRRGPSFGE